MSTDRRLQIARERFDLSHAVIRNTDRSDLSRRHQIIERASDIGRMGKKIGAMDVEQVDAPDSEARQTGFAGRLQISGRGIVGAARLASCLGRDHCTVEQLRRLGAHRPEQLFGAAETALTAIDIGRVEMIAAARARQTDHGDGVVHLIFAVAPETVAQAFFATLGKSQHPRLLLGVLRLPPKIRAIFGKPKQ